MQPEWNKSDVHEKFPIPWRLLVPFVLLAVALGYSVAHGRMWDPIVIAVLLVPALGLFGVSVYLRVRGRRT